MGAGLRRSESDTNTMKPNAFVPGAVIGLCISSIFTGASVKALDDRLTALEQEFRISRATLFEELNRLRAIEPAPVFDEAGRIQHYAGTDGGCPDL
jgi:hypothetical protein